MGRHLDSSDMHYTINEAKRICRDAIDVPGSDPGAILLKPSFIHGRDWVVAPVVENIAPMFVNEIIEFMGGHNSDLFYVFPCSEETRISIPAELGYGQPQKVIHPEHIICIEDSNMYIEDVISEATSIYGGYFIVDSKISMMVSGLSEVFFLVAAPNDWVCELLGKSLKDAFVDFEKDIEDIFGHERTRRGYEIGKYVMEHSLSINRSM